MATETSEAGERGFTLITVLWTVSLLTLIASVFIASSRSHVQTTTNALENAEALALAEAGVHLAILDLVSNASGGPGRRFPLSRPTVCALAGRGDLAITIADEGGKLDLNFAEGPQLRRLFEGLGLSSSEAARLADVIADYRDADDRARPNGAERAEYAAAGIAEGPANGPFVAIEELDRLPGLPSGLAERLQTLTTVHSGTGEVDLAAAPAELAAALGGALAGAGTADGARPTGRNVFTVSVGARTPRGAVAATAAIVRLRPGGQPPFTIERWLRRDRRGASEGLLQSSAETADPC